MEVSGVPSDTTIGVSWVEKFQDVLRFPFGSLIPISGFCSPAMGIIGSPPLPSPEKHFYGDSISWPSVRPSLVLWDLVGASDDEGLRKDEVTIYSGPVSQK